MFSKLLFIAAVAVIGVAHSADTNSTTKPAIDVGRGSGHLFAAGIDYTVGTLNLTSPHSAGGLDVVQRWTSKDLPGIDAINNYCNPVIAADAHLPVVYLFAGPGCAYNAGGSDFSPAAILAYDFESKNTTVYGNIPAAQYAKDPYAKTGHIFDRVMLDEARGVFYVVSNSNVIGYEFTLGMLLEFNPRTGKTTALANFGMLMHVENAVYDPQLQLIFLGVNGVTSNGTTVRDWDRTAIFDTRSRSLTWLDVNSNNLPLVAGFDPVAQKILAVQNTNEVGHLTCDNKARCTFTAFGRLGKMLGVDRITGLAWDPAERLLSVQTRACYNATAPGPPICTYMNLLTEKFVQYNMPNLLAAPGVFVPSYAYETVSNSNDNNLMVWAGLANAK